jgi:tRNA threonylcarbamoyladenosine biosynthesis protein TsaE
MSQSTSIKLSVASAAAMRELGTALGDALLASTGTAQCVAIEGDLGAGKTTLVSGVLFAAGIAGPVRSPTYTLIEPYEARGRSIYHMDLYRLVHPSELEPLGVRDLLTPNSILLIEWPSRAGSRLPPLDVSIEIGYRDPPEAGREVQIEAISALGTEVLARLLR